MRIYEGWDVEVERPKKFQVEHLHTSTIQWMSSEITNLEREAEGNTSSLNCM